MSVFRSARRHVFPIASCGLYAAALLLPAAQRTAAMEVRVFGYEALLHGWDWPYTIPWSANVALLIAWIALFAARARVAAVAGTAAVAVALTAPSIYGVPFSELGIGFFLWLASCIASAIGGAVQVRRISNQGGDSATRVAPV